MEGSEVVDVEEVIGLLAELRGRRSQESLESLLVVDLENALGVGEGCGIRFVHGVEDEPGIVPLLRVGEELVQSALHADVEFFGDFVALDVHHMEGQRQSGHVLVELHAVAAGEGDLAVGGESGLLQFCDVFIQIGGPEGVLCSVRQGCEGVHEGRRPGEAVVAHGAELVQHHLVDQFLVILVDAVEGVLWAAHGDVVGGEMLVGILFQPEGQDLHRDRQHQRLGESCVPHKDFALDLLCPVGGQFEGQQETLRLPGGEGPRGEGREELRHPAEALVFGFVHVGVVPGVDDVPVADHPDLRRRIAFEHHVEVLQFLKAIDGEVQRDELVLRAPAGEGGDALVGQGIGLAPDRFRQRT